MSFAQYRHALAGQPEPRGRLGEAGDHRLSPRRGGDLAHLRGPVDRAGPAAAGAAGVPRARPGAGVPAGRAGPRGGRGGRARGAGRSGHLLAGDARSRGQHVPGASAGAGRDATRAGRGGDSDAAADRGAGLGERRVHRRSAGCAHLGPARPACAARRCGGCARGCGRHRRSDRAPDGRARHTVSGQSAVCASGTADTAARSPSTRQASARTIRTSRSASTTSPGCCKPPTGSARRNR